MPILYVHGVATRDSLGFEALKPYAQRLVAPVISNDPEQVLVEEVFWGGSAATFAWKGASRPRTRLIGQGEASARPAAALGLMALLERKPGAHVEIPLPTGEPGEPRGDGSGLISGGRTAEKREPVRLSSLTNDELADLLAALAFTTRGGADAAKLALAGDALAHDDGFRARLAKAGTAEAEMRVLFDELDARPNSETGLVGMGSGWQAALRDRLGETLSRGGSLAAYGLSTFAAEMRPWLNETASLFLGDVFVYLNSRGTVDDPGPIVKRLLDALEAAQASKEARGGEPLVVITHSMGGQLVYDVVTYFLPRDARRRHIRIDFWCATASQVGFFEELKLFLASNKSIQTPDRVTFPEANLGVWWNVWDHNDFLSFTVRDIFAGVDDESYDSGTSLAAAHSGYLRRPSFYRKLAAKLRTAADAGWRTV